MSDLGADDGLYELLVTNDVQAGVELATGKAIERHPVADADQPHVLARHVYQAAVRNLESVKDPELRVQAANDLITLLEAGDPDHVIAPPRQLSRISTPAGPGTVS